MRHTFRYLVGSVPAPGDVLPLSDEDTHHLVRVIRRGPGEGLELIDPGGARWEAVLESVGPPATVRVGAPAPPLARGPRVSLYLGLADWGRVDVAMEKAVELGVVDVCLFTSERAGRVPDASAWGRRRERLERVAQSAARQSGRAPLGRVRGLVPFPEVIAEIPMGEGFLIDPRGDAPLLSALCARAGSVAPIALVVGPQAGFSEPEVAHARLAGIPVCTLGSAVLRAETAAIAAVAIAAASDGAR